MLRTCTLCFIETVVYKALKPNMQKHYSIFNLPYHSFLSHNKIRQIYWSNHVQYMFSPAVSPNRETLNYRQTIHEFDAKMPNLIFFQNQTFLVILQSVTSNITTTSIYSFVFAEKSHI